MGKKKLVKDILNVKVRRKKFQSSEKMCIFAE